MPNTPTPAPVPEKTKEARSLTIKWPRMATVESTLPGNLIPRGEGVEWIPNEGHRLEVLERHGSRVFCAIIGPNGCEILIAEMTGLRKAPTEDIPSSVLIKALALSDGADLDGDLIIPIRLGDGPSGTAPKPAKAAAMDADAIAKYCKGVESEKEL